MGSSSSVFGPEHEENKSKAHVLVIGGGFGGAHCCQALKKHGLKFTLVDAKSFMYHHLASVRAVVTPDLTKSLVFDYKKTFGDSFVQGMVVSVSLADKKADLDTGEEISFTKVVFAVGGTGPFPGNSKQTEVDALCKEMEEAGSDLEKAETVVICGGGAVGTELAGEIRDRYADKKIIIVHSRQRLVSDSMGTKLQNNLKCILEGMNVELRFGCRVSNLKELTANKHVKQTVKIEDGENIEADFVFKCIGMKTRTEVTSALFDLNDMGQVKVQSDLRVVGQEDAYAIGDCCGYEQEKMAAHAEDHGILVAENINLALAGKDGKAYVPRFTGMVVTVGKGGGAGVYNGWSIPSFVVAKIKGKSHMFLDMTGALMKPVEAKL
jgi:NADH dehydrogenase FAD-containing subunit